MVREAGHDKDCMLQIKNVQDYNIFPQLYAVLGVTLYKVTCYSNDITVLGNEVK